MDQKVLDNAAEQASKRMEQTFYRDGSQKFMSDKDIKSASIPSGEDERARLIAEERRKLLQRGEFNIPSRDKYIVGLEERRKEQLWKTMDEREKARMVATDSRAAEEMDKELGSKYNITPDMFFWKKRVNK